MAYNSNYTNPYFSGQPQYISPYGNNNAYMQAQQPVAQQPPMQQPYIQPQQQMVYEIPIQAVKLVTADEAKAYIVMPNQRVLLIDRANGVAYDKSADSLGQSRCKTYHFTDDEKIIDIPPTSTINAEEYAKRDELDQFVKADDLSALESKIMAQMEDLKKSVIEKYLKGETRKGDIANGNK
jgi:hypothetical protein